MFNVIVEAEWVDLARDTLDAKQLMKPGQSRDLSNDDGDERFVHPWTPKDFGMVEWMDHSLLELVTSPIFLIVSFFLLFAIIVKWAMDQKEKNAREKRERLKCRV